MKKNIPIQIRLEESVKKKLIDLAEEIGLSQSKTIELILKERFGLVAVTLPRKAGLAVSEGDKNDGTGRRKGKSAEGSREASF